MNYYNLKNQLCNWLAFSGVKQCILVDLIRYWRYSCKSVIPVDTPTYKPITIPIKIKITFCILKCMWFLYLIFPLKLGPHLPKLCIRATCGQDVVHDVNPNFIHHYNIPIACRSSNIINYISKDERVFSAGHLDTRPDVREIRRSQNDGLGTLYQFQLSTCSQLQSAILQRIRYKSIQNPKFLIFFFILSFHQFHTS